MALNLERPGRVRAVYDVLMREQGNVPRAAAAAVDLGGDLEASRKILEVVRSHDDLHPSCTTHGSCLHSTWDIASEIVDTIDGPA